MYSDIVKQLYPIEKKKMMGFPGGSVVKNSLANAGDIASIADPEKIPHAAGQLSPYTTTTESAL